MSARQRHCEDAAIAARLDDAERGGVTPRGNISGAPVNAFACSKRLHATERTRRKRGSIGAVGANQGEAIARNEVDQSPERKTHGIEIRVNIRVIELDVVDD